MPLKPYQYLLLAGWLFAITQAIARLAHWEAPVEVLEPLSFLLCMAGILVGKHTQQTKKNTKKRNRSAALRNQDYLGLRSEFQRWAAPTVAAVCSLV